MKRVNVVLCESEIRHVLRKWEDVQSAQILDIEYQISSRSATITKKDGGKVFLLVSTNNTLIIEEFVELENE